MQHIHIFDKNIEFSKVIVDVFTAKKADIEPIIIAHNTTIPQKQRFEEEIEFNSYQQVLKLKSNEPIYQEEDVALGIENGIIKSDDKYYLVYHVMIMYKKTIYNLESEKIAIGEEYYEKINQCQTDRDLIFFSLISPDECNEIDLIKEKFGTDPFIIFKDCLEKILKKINI